MIERLAVGGKWLPTSLTRLRSEPKVEAAASSPAGERAVSRWSSDSLLAATADPLQRSVRTARWPFNPLRGYRAPVGGGLEPSGRSRAPATPLDASLVQLCLPIDRGARGPLGHRAEP